LLLSAVPSTIVNEGDDGKFRVIFYPKHTEGPAEYLVALSLEDKKGNDAKVRGGPYRVIVNIVRNAGKLIRVIYFLNPINSSF
jgi:hypothetical protein